MLQLVSKLTTELKVEGLYMNDSKMSYFKDEDILHLAISEEKECSSVEISPNITAELNDMGELIGIEIIDASSFLRDTILESVQAKLLQIAGNAPNA